MEEFDFLNDIDPVEFSLEAILAEFKSQQAFEQSDEAIRLPSERQSSPVTMRPRDDAVSEAEIASGRSGSNRRVQPRGFYPPSDLKTAPEAKASAGHAQKSASAQRAGAGFSREKTPEEEFAERRGVDSRELYRYSGDEGDYARADHPKMTSEQREKLERTVPKTGRLGIALLGIIALLAMRRRQRNPNAAVNKRQVKSAAQPGQTPEVTLKKASKIYAAQVAPFKLRGITSLALSLVLVYLSLSYNHNLPLFGMLAHDPVITAALSLVLLLAVMLTGLDVVTGGILALARNRPGAESLVAFSCLASIINVLYIITSGNTEHGSPYCALAAISVTCAIYSSRLYCQGFYASFRAAAQNSSPFCVGSERGLSGKGAAVMKTRRPPDGFVKKAEEPDLAEGVWQLLAPVLIVACLVLALLSTVIRGRASDFFFAYSAMCAVCASFSSLLSFPLPYYVTSKRLAGSGAALAGWAGTQELAAARNVVITDSDVFPGGTMSVSGVRVLEGMSTAKAISYTGSVIAASGSQLGAAFTELMRRQGCTMQRVEDFSFHEGGGLTAIVGGEIVLAGTSGFMRLMGVTLPKNQIVKDAVYSAISGTLVGVFTVEYIPVVSVQDALVSLLGKRTSPLFAIRDFNITPAMIKQKFRVPTDGFEFLSFADRYRISAWEPEVPEAPSALLSREGLGPLAAVYSLSKRLYRATRLCVILSALGAVAGLLIMFFLCFSASLDAANAANALIFMLVWLVPVLLASFGIRR